jgi:hypothetical protein
MVGSMSAKLPHGASKVSEGSQLDCCAKRSTRWVSSDNFEIEIDLVPYLTRPPFPSLYFHLWIRSLLRGTRRQSGCCKLYDLRLAHTRATRPGKNKDRPIAWLSPGCKKSVPKYLRWSLPHQRSQNGGRHPGGFIRKGYRIYSFPCQGASRLEQEILDIRWRCFMMCSSGS